MERLEGRTALLAKDLVLGRESTWSEPQYSEAGFAEHTVAGVGRTMVGNANQ